MSTFAGRWFTSFGPMELKQTDGVVEGAYWYDGHPSRITGEVTGSRLDFRYEDATGPGEGWFELTGAGQFRGHYRLDGTPNWVPWMGQREWNGIWDTVFGRMRLTQEDDRVHGFYDGASSGRVEGRVDGKRLILNYIEPASRGEAWFELDQSLNVFRGGWRPQGTEAWRDWSGQRIRPQPNLTWLMVIEAHWQRSLGDTEYSYGEMLRTFFARVPTVAVRQRYFNDGPSLERWCRELTYVPEPAIVLISSHGTQAGVGVHNHIIDPKRIVDCLREAGNIQLLHFATCLCLKEDYPNEFASRIGAPPPFPISGYSTSVDWGGSAILEFNYLDLMLSKHMTPEHAAQTMLKNIAWAGDKAPADSPYGAAGFRFFKPAASRVLSGVV